MGNQSHNANKQGEPQIHKKLEELNIKLPEATKPVANYQQYTKTGNLVFISGQLPIQNGQLSHRGQVGKEVSAEEGVKAAQIATLNILAQLQSAIGSLSRIKQCIKITGFVSCGPNFTNHPEIINGASTLLVSILGNKGQHARATVGVSSLPLGAPVEIEAIFEVEDC